MITKLLMNRWGIAPALVVLFVGLSPLGVNAQTTFDDTEFFNADWENTVVISTPSSGASDVQQAAGGTPTAANREITHSLAACNISGCGVSGGPSSKVVSVHLNKAALWDPATNGAIDTIDHSEDARTVSTEANTFGGQAWFALEQGGDIYIATIGPTRDPPSGGLPSPWIPRDRNDLTSGHFVQLLTSLTVADSGFWDGSKKPDFTSSGAPIKFGYARASSHTGDCCSTRTTAIDNWKVTVHPVRPSLITLTPITTAFNNPIGIDHHEPTNSVVVSVNYSTGSPHNFELLNLDGTHTQFSNVAGFTDEVKIATARDNLGGFTPGELFVGNGDAGEIVRISADGSVVTNPWVTLPNESGLFRGSLHVDRTGDWGGDLIVVTTAGGCLEGKLIRYRDKACNDRQHSPGRFDDGSE